MKDVSHIQSFPWKTLLFRQKWLSETTSCAQLEASKAAPLENQNSPWKIQFQVKQWLLHPFQIPAGSHQATGDPTGCKTFQQPQLSLHLPPNTSPPAEPHNFPLLILLLLLLLPGDLHREEQIPSSQSRQELQCLAWTPPRVQLSPSNHHSQTAPTWGPLSLLPQPPPAFSLALNSRSSFFFPDSNTSCYFFSHNHFRSCSCCCTRTTHTPRKSCILGIPRNTNPDLWSGREEGQGCACPGLRFLGIASWKTLQQEKQHRAKV